VAPAALAILDDEGEEVVLDADETAALFVLTDDLDAATVSACPRCRSRIVAVVALVASCDHDTWRDPGYAEWIEAIEDLVES
jgi:hypothetical protein